MEVTMPKGAERILRALTNAGFEAYLVGGCVRDFLRGAPPQDWDICTSALPEETGECFRDLRIMETGLKHGTLTVLVGEEAYEVTTYRSDGPYSDGRRPDRVRFVSDLREDLSRRDFTMNAIAMDLEGNLQDPFGGERDIRERRIRCVGEPVRRFQEDGLRIMRALRFSAVLGYILEEETAKAVHTCRAMLDHVAAERIHVELCKLIVGPRAGKILREFPDVLRRFWPELEPLANMEQRNPWHCWNGWEHTLRAVEAAPADEVLRLTMLLHDVGKPRCKTTDEEGIDHFYGHPEVGSKMAEDMLRRLKFENEVRRQVVTLVKYHDVDLCRSPRTVRRWLSRLGRSTFFRLLEVKRADALAQNRERSQKRLKELAEIRLLAEKLIEEGQCLSLKELDIDGGDVLAAGIPPGPEVGRTLERLLSEVLDGTLPNKQEELLKRIGEIFQSGEEK